MKHVFIVNPAAGKRDRTAEIQNKAAAAFAQTGQQYEILRSQRPGDCMRLAREAAECGEDVRIYACGGDGTLNEVVNGAAGYDNVSVTHYPGGSGNDTIKLFSQTEPFFHLDRLLDSEQTRFDLIRCNGRYCINILSMGLDARISAGMAKFKRLPLLSGHGAYVLSLLVNLLKGLSQQFTVQIDGRQVADGRKTLVCVCNGRWYGGGYNPVPDAEPDDGLLDVLIIKKINLTQVAKLLGKYQHGRYAELPDYISHYRCRSVRICSDKVSVVNVDGESIYTDCAEISVCPASVRFFYPAGLRYKSENSQIRHKISKISP